MKENRMFIKTAAVICMISLTKCGIREPEAQQVPEDVSVSDSETEEQDIAPIDSADASSDSPAEREAFGNQTQEEDQSSGEKAQEEAFHVPVLPDTGSGLIDFVPEGWTLWDSVELDFNEDGIPDFVGVLDTVLPDAEDGSRPDFMPPRILFAIASDGTGNYCLDFQDINLIRTRAEGGVFGDPYEPLTAEGTSFTTHAYGGSAWRWSEADTYTFREGTWYKTMSESTYGYGPLITSRQKDDWESGIGVRKKRSDEFEEMEKYLDSEDPWEETYDVEYEVSLDEPLTLYQAGMRWWLAPDRMTDWKVESVVCSEDAVLSEERVKHPEEAYLSGYCDEDCVLYTFRDEDSPLYYLAMYRFQDRSLSVLAESETSMDSAEVYKGKIYYSTEIVKEVSYKQIQDGQEQIIAQEDTVGVSLNRMNPDGSGKESIFEYRYPGTEQEILESRVPYLSLIYEISGDEIIAEVYVGSEPHPVYRMESDGSNLRQIGQIPGES